MVANRRGHDGPEPRAGERRRPGDIFISYRRGYANAHAHAIRERLLRQYKDERVFMDVDSIVPGTDFVQRIEEALDSSAVMLVLIARDFLREPVSQRGLDNPDDFVRIEVGAALDRKVPTIPVLIEDTPLPDREQLPEPLRPLVRLQAVTLANASWDHDLSRVVDAVASLIEHRRRRSWRRLPTRFADMIRRHLQSGQRRRLVVGFLVAVSLAILGTVLALFLVSSGPQQPKLVALANLAPGDCLQVPEPYASSNVSRLYFWRVISWPARMPVVSCGQLHSGEVFFADDLWSAQQQFPGTGAVYLEAGTHCITAFTTYVGIAPDKSSLNYINYAPSARSWAAGDRHVFCVAYNGAGNDLSNSIQGSAE